MSTMDEAPPLAGDVAARGVTLREALDTFTDEALRMAYYAPSVDPERVAAEANRLRDKAQERAADPIDERRERSRVFFEDMRERRGFAPQRRPPLLTYEEQARQMLTKKARTQAWPAFLAALRDMLTSGKLVAIGRPNGLHLPFAKIAPDVWPHLTMDVDRNTASGAGVVFHLVRVARPAVSEAPAPPASVPMAIPLPEVAPVAAKRARPGGADYREQDAALIAEMTELMCAGRARNRLDAARAVAGRAAGAGTERSKVDRLRKLHAASQPAGGAVEPVEP